MHESYFLFETFDQVGCESRPVIVNDLLPNDAPAAMIASHLPPTLLPPGPMFHAS